MPYAQENARRRVGFRSRAGNPRAPAIAARRDLGAPCSGKQRSEYRWAARHNGRQDQQGDRYVLGGSLGTPRSGEAPTR